MPLFKTRPVIEPESPGPLANTLPLSHLILKKQEENKFSSREFYRSDKPLNKKNKKKTTKNKKKKIVKGYTHIRILPDLEKLWNVKATTMSVVGDTKGLIKKYWVIWR